MRLFSDAIATYVAYLRSETRYARTSIKSYGSNLRRICRWYDEKLGEPATLADFERDDLFIAFLQWTETKPTKGGVGMTNSTQNGYINCIRAFAKWLIEREQITHNPGFGEIKLRKPAAGDQPTPEEAEMRQLIKGCRHIYPPTKRLMYTAMLEMLCWGGLRRHELLNLTIGQVRLGKKPEDNYVFFRGKGAKERKVFLMTSVAKAMKAWLDARKNLPIAPEHPFVWVVSKTRRAGLTTLFTAIDAAICAAELEDSPEFNPHALRRGCISFLHSKGYPTKYAMIQSGHSSMKVHESYIDKNDVKRARLLHELTTTSETDLAEQTGEIAPSRKRGKNAAWRSSTEKRKKL